MGRKRDRERARNRNWDRIRDRQDKWTAEDVRNLLCDPYHALQGIVTDQQWIDAVCRLARTRGHGDTLESVYRRVVNNFIRHFGVEISRLTDPNSLVEFKRDAETRGLEQAFRTLLDRLRSIRDATWIPGEEES